MFGLTVEKLLLVVLLAALVFGPHRLPEAARTLARLLRSTRSALDTGRDRVMTESGLSDEDWRGLDPRQYDPRRIVRDALTAPETPPAATTADAPVTTPATWRIEGSSAHPRRVRVPPSRPLGGDGA